jgi:uncharacterized membrane protein
VDPFARVLLALLGAGLGSRVGDVSGKLLCAVLGGLAALGVGEIFSLNSRVRALGEEVARLRRGASTREAAGLEKARVNTEARDGAGARAEVGAAALAEQLEAVRALEAPRQQEIQREPEMQGAPNRPRVDAMSTARVDDVSAETSLAMVNLAAPLRWVREFLTGGNAVVRVGIIILLFGIGFLLRYLAEHSQVPIGWRLSGVAAGGVALLGVGWRLRGSRAGYALALQGGGVGILYLTVFGALRLYSLLTPALAFPLLVAVAVLAATAAVAQNSLSLALIGVAGGFLAPVLASSGQGSHVVLFSYYTVLNLGIFGVAWFKAWRPLNIAGFVFTFVIGTAWGVLRYRPEFFSSTEPFLVVFFALYVGIVMLSGVVDGTLVFGTPLVVLALQASMLHERLPLAASAAAMGAMYVTLAWLLKRRALKSHAMLVEAFIAIGVTCVTLAVPLALHARLNAAAWSVEGVALVWVGCRRERVLARVAGALLSLAAGLIVANEFNLGVGHGGLPAAAYPEAVLQGVASIGAACVLHRYRLGLKSFEQALPAGLFWWGLWWWLASSHSQIARLWPDEELAGSMLLFACTALACSELERRVALGAARIAALLQLPMMLLAAAFAVGSVAHPAANLGWLAWPLAFGGLYGVMCRLEGAADGALAKVLHAGATWLACGVGGWEAAWQMDRALAGSDVWWVTAWAVMPVIVLGLLPRLVTRVPWPFGKNREAYISVVGVGLAVFLAGWSLMANLGSRGDFAPLPYLPLLNPLDIAQAVVLTVLFTYWRFVGDVKPVAPAVLTAITFAWLNAILLRTLHQWFGAEYGWDALLESTLVQTALSIFWALLAFGTMLMAARRQRRVAWLAGAGLLGVVIGKLFLVDLSRVGSVERIVSFVGVGLLMLVVGYVSPLPPASEEASA